jgi:MscS family membrane protein
MSEVLNAVQQWLSGDDSWIAQVFLVVFLTLLANFLARRFFDKLEKKLKSTHNLWDDALISAVRSPVAIGIWVVGVSWAAEIVKALSEAIIFEAIEPLREILIIVLLAWFLVRFIRAGEANLLAATPTNEKAELDEQTVHALGKLLRAAVIITTALVMLQTLGYSISGVLAFGGVGGIAIGFAAKDLLANFFGGLMIYLDRPFKIGDWIRSPDQEIEGTVEYIGWRLTIIRTFDKRPLYVPNSTFTQISVENPSRMTNRRIYETIGLRYDDAKAVDVIVANVKTMLQEHEAIDQSQTLMVNFNAFGESSLDFFIYCFTKTTNWQQFHVIKHEILLKVLAIIEEQGAEAAFPTRVIQMASPAEPVAR